MSMREEFEVAIAEESGQPLVAIQLSRMADSYSTSALIYAWWAWQQSRKAVMIELPQQSGADLTWNQAIRYCHQAIEAAGLKVTR